MADTVLSWVDYHRKKADTLEEVVRAYPDVYYSDLGGEEVLVSQDLQVNDCDTLHVYYDLPIPGRKSFAYWTVCRSLLVRDQVVKVFPPASKRPMLFCKDIADWVSSEGRLASLLESSRKG